MNDEHDAPDVIHRSSFSTWLTRIAVSEALAHRRRRGVPFEEGEEDVPDTRTLDPERQAAASELRQVMEEEVESLPDSFRAAVAYNFPIIRFSDCVVTNCMLLRR